MTATPPIAGLKLLVIDDDTSLRSTLVTALSRFGYDVKVAADGLSGLRILKGQPDIALVLLDGEMPGMSGMDVLKELGKWYERPPVIMMSARSQKEDVVAAIRAGAVDYIVKPLHLGNLVLKINKAVSRFRKDTENTPTQTADLNLEATISFSIIDISESGCAFKSSFPLAVDSILILESDDITSRLDLSPEECFPLRVANCSKLGKGYKIGAQFIGLSSEVQQKLRMACSSPKGFKVSKTE